MYSTTLMQEPFFSCISSCFTGRRDRTLHRLAHNSYLPLLTCKMSVALREIKVNCVCITRSALIVIIAVPLGQWQFSILLRAWSVIFEHIHIAYRNKNRATPIHSSYSIDALCKKDKQRKAYLVAYHHLLPWPTNRECILPWSWQHSGCQFSASWPCGTYWSVKMTCWQPIRQYQQVEQRHQIIQCRFLLAGLSTAGPELQTWSTTLDSSWHFWPPGLSESWAQIFTGSPEHRWIIHIKDVISLCLKLNAFAPSFVKSSKRALQLVHPTSSRAQSPAPLMLMSSHNFPAASSDWPYFFLSLPMVPMALSQWPQHQPKFCTCGNPGHMARLCWNTVRLPSFERCYQTTPFMLGQQIALLCPWFTLSLPISLQVRSPTRHPDCVSSPPKVENK